MREKEVAVHKDLLFVALTRIPTVAGIPYMAFVIEIMFASLVIIMIGQPQYLLSVIPIHGILYLISAKDPGIFAEIEVWMKTIGRCLNKGFWDAASFSPLQTRKWKQ
ncbi:type IV secretion system protein VirB3 [Methylotenera sp. G11]|uniref:type IV secretion system protein VirB3 n=1 Tax=Methylotenera sp. G11 TaxID=1506585 RepID=UPI0006486434|nr:VirB3 family type IV secretion system protein [Methylotenera sp. G11]